MKKKIILILAIFFILFSGLWATPKKGKFQLEVFGGLSLMDPADLNAYPKIWEEYFNFWHQQRHDYNVKAGYYQSFDFDREGDFETIKSAFPLGLRIRWNVYKSLSISLGFKYISAKASSPVDHFTEILLNNGVLRENLYSFSQLAISASGWVPLLGIHWEKKLSPRTGLELYASGGPFSGKCDLGYDYVREQREDNVLTSSSIVSVREEGKGQGISLEAFVRLNHSLSKGLGFFFETGYVLQKVNSLEGPGVLNVDGNLDEWEGEWGMKEKYAADYWGQYYIIYPSNAWEFSEDKRWVRYFNLDLSGFQVRIGFSFQF